MSVVGRVGHPFGTPDLPRQSCQNLRLWTPTAKNNFGRLFDEDLFSSGFFHKQYVHKGSMSNDNYVRPFRGKLTGQIRISFNDCFIRKGDSL